MFFAVATAAGSYTKAEVRALAAAAGLSPATKRSSAGICFVGRRRFSNFLESYLPPRAGVYLDAVSGRILGRCSNMLAITGGQRAGLGGQAEPYFVVGTDLEQGKVWVAPGHEHPALYSNTVLLQAPHWVEGVAPVELGGQQGWVGQYKARYRQGLQDCVLHACTSIVSAAAADASGDDVCRMAAASTEGAPSRAAPPIGDGFLAKAAAVKDAGGLGQSQVQSDSKGGMDYMFFPSRFYPSPKQLLEGQGIVESKGMSPGGYLVAHVDPACRGLTPGQAFVLYDGDVCLGSTLISAPGMTLYEQ